MSLNCYQNHPKQKKKQKVNNMNWVNFESARPADLAMVMYYVPDGKYVWGVGQDYDSIKVEYPLVTHWSVFVLPPSK